MLRKVQIYNMIMCYLKHNKFIDLWRNTINVHEINIVQFLEWYVYLAKWVAGLRNEMILISLLHWAS